MLLSGAALRMSIFVGRQLTRRRLAIGRPRSLWGVTPILTLPLKARCDRALGISSESFVLKNYHVTNAFDWNLKRLAEKGPVARFPLARFKVSLLRLFLSWALLRYDIFHYFADRGVLPPDGRYGIGAFELDVLRRAGKRLYVFAYGADVRTREKTLALGGWNFCRDCSDPGKYCLCDDRSGEAILKRISDSATATVALGDMLAYLPGARHIAYWPIDHERMTYVGVRNHEGPLRIVHAPNHMHFKGTRYLEEALARLKARNVELELVIVSGVPNEEVLKLIAEADILADQFIGGAYGYTALEGLARGKPVLTYVRDRSLTIAPEECPFINATPDTLEDVLTWCVHNRALLPQIGRQGRSYVERHHSIPAVAARFARLYIETADLPLALTERFESFILDEDTRRNTVPTYADWHHPWTA